MDNTLKFVYRLPAVVDKAVEVDDGHPDCELSPRFFDLFFPRSPLFISIMFGRARTHFFFMNKSASY